MRQPLGRGLFYAISMCKFQRFRHEDSPNAISEFQNSIMETSFETNVKPISAL